MKRTMLAFAATVALSSHLMSVSAGANTLSAFGESVSCNIVGYVLKIPIDLCSIAKKEFPKDISLTVLSKKAEAYCGTSNLSRNGAPAMLEMGAASDSKRCAAVLAVACARHSQGC